MAKGEEEVTNVEEEEVKVEEMAKMEEEKEE